MPLSPEVQAQADEIRRNKSLVRSLQAERDLWKQKAGEAYGKLEQLTGKREMSDEDREEIKRQSAELDALNDELEGAAHENTKPEGDHGPGGEKAQREDPQAKYKNEDGTAKSPEEIAELRGQERSEAGAPAPMVETDGQAPLMPNLAFNPHGDGKSPPAAADGGQPQQPPAIETSGGFVVAGGGSTHRAPGSKPESPSSTLVVPEDPNAKAPASTADEVKSGLGDSSQNATVDAEGKVPPSGASQQENSPQPPVGPAS